MSVRTPVALVYLPNQPYLLGTFDTTTFKNWWKSKPFPDNIEFIKKGMHVYGRKQLSIAKRIDGRWAVYLSPNYGIDWERVYLADVGEVIYDLILIKFGWVIMNTSTGFYESVKAGSAGSWTKISGLPGASAVPAFCNLGFGDILLCTDGRYIWRSTDKARHWAQVCDQAQIDYRRYSFEYNWLTWFAWTAASPLVPAIAGANGEVLCSYGPWITISLDGGVTWTNYSEGQGNDFIVNHWDSYSDGLDKSSEEGGPFFPPKSIIYDRFPENATAPPKFLIKQILVSKVGGSRIEDVKYVLRVDDLVPVPGQDKLFSRVFYAHHGQYFHPTHQVWADDPGGPTFHPVFQQFLSPDDNLNQLASYETAIMGSDAISRVVVSAQTTQNSSGVSIPSFKYSVDGGRKWNALDVSAVKVYDGQGLPTAGGSFLDDSYIKSVWVSSGCDNYGSWSETEEGVRVQSQSYEMDLLMESAERDVQKPQPVDSIIEKDGEEPESVDAVLSKDQSKPCPVDGLFEGLAAKTYLVDRTLEGIPEKLESVDSIVSDDKSEYDVVDAVFEKNLWLIYKVDVGMHDKNHRTYLVDTKLVTDDLYKRLARVHRTFPQVFDLWLPEIPQGVYNSAWEFIE